MSLSGSSDSEDEALNKKIKELELQLKVGQREKRKLDATLQNTKVQNTCYLLTKACLETQATTTEQPQYSARYLQARARKDKKEGKAKVVVSNSQEQQSQPQVTPTGSKAKK